MKTGLHVRVSVRLAVRLLVGAALLGGYGALMWRGLEEEWRLLGPYLPLLGGAAVVGGLVGALRPEWLRRLGRTFTDMPAWAFVGGAMLLALVTALACQRYAHADSLGTPDEVTYLFQARMLAAGHLYAPAPPHHEFFQFRFCLQQGGKWFGIFPPGWPAVLSFGVWLGAPLLVNPVLSALLVLLAYLLARELLPGRPLVWRLVAALGAFSLLRVEQGATLMSHTLGAICTTGALLAGLRALRTGRARWLVLLGVCLGVQANTRLLNAFALGVPALALTGAFVWRHRGAWRRVALGLGSLGAVVALFAGLQLEYNRRITGSAGHFPQRAYFEATENKPHCSDPGFGADRVCGYEHPPGLAAALPRKDFYPSHGVRVTYVRFDAYAREAASGIVLFAFLWIGLLAPSTRRAAAFCLLVYGTLWLAYGTFYYHGLAYGARYYLEGTACVWIGVALGLAAALRPPADGGPTRRAGRAAAVLRGAGGVVALLLIFVQPLARWPFAAHVWFRDLSRYHDPMLRAIAGLEQAGIRAIIAYPSEWGVPVFNERPWALASQPVIVVSDIGTGAAEELLRHFPGRRLYRWDANADRLEAVHLTPERVVLEPEMFHPGERARYGHARPVMGNGIACLKLFGDRAGAQTEVVAHFPEGRYEVRPMLISGPDAGRIRLEIDGQPLVSDLDLFDLEVHPVTPSPRTVTLRGEAHLVRLIVVGKRPLASAYTACLDRLVLDRQPAAPASQP